MSDEAIDGSRKINARCLDYLLMEMISTSIRVSHIKEEREDIVASSASKSSGTAAAATAAAGGNTNTASSSTGSSSLELIDIPGSVAILDHPSINGDDVTLRNENYGFHVGIRLGELLMYMAPATSQSAKITNILDIMKFVCRDVWKSLYGKQMDNLRTNHRGIFVLVDNNCRVISSMNSAKGLPDSITRAKSFLWFPCGLIRGILLSFGIESLVSAEIVQFPSVTFSIQTSINN